MDVKGKKKQHSGLPNPSDLPGPAPAIKVNGAASKAPPPHGKIHIKPARVHDANDSVPPPPMRVRIAAGEALQTFREHRHKDWAMTRTNYDELQNPDNFFQSGLNREDFCKLALYSMTPEDEDKMNPYRVAGRLPALIIPGDHDEMSESAYEARRAEASELVEIGGSMNNISWLLASHCVELWRTLLKDNPAPTIMMKARDCMMKTAMEMQRADQAMGKPVEMLRQKLQLWLDRWGGKTYTAIGSPDDLQRAFHHVTEMRDETIAVQRACEDISTSYIKLGDEWNRLFITSLISPASNCPPETPGAWTPLTRESREKLCLMGEGIIKHVLLSSQAYSAPKDVLRTMFDSYDRLHKECFIGIIRREAAMGWANIWKAQWSRYVEAYDNLEMGKKLEEVIGNM